MLVAKADWLVVNADWLVAKADWLVAKSDWQKLIGSLHKVIGLLQKLIGSLWKPISSMDKAFVAIAVLSLLWPCLRNGFSLVCFKMLATGRKNGLSEHFVFVHVYVIVVSCAREFCMYLVCVLKSSVCVVGSGSKNESSRDLGMGLCYGEPPPQVFKETIAFLR